MKTFRKIGDYANVKGGKRLPKGVSLLEEITNHPYLRVVDFKFDGIDRSNIKYIDEETYEQIKRYTISSNDIYISIAGTIGRVGIVPDDLDGANLTENAAKITDISDDVDQRYLMYYLRSPKGQKAILNRVGGTSQPKLALYKIKDIEFPWKPLDEQRRIASILSAYDDLIENNRRRIQLLEQAARLIYKEWFVHLRFPGHEHVKIIDGVPEGWERKRLGDILLELESGGRPKGGSVESGVPSIGAENVLGIGRYDFSKEKFVPEEYFANMRKGIVQNRDVVVYKDGANIGRSSYFGDGFPHEKCCVNEHVFILRALPEVGQNYLYFWIERDEVRQSIANLNANTAQPGVSQEKLRTLPIIVPERRILRLFNNTVEPMVRQIFLFAKMTKTLTKARDFLLPRLMNGEVTL